LPTVPTRSTLLYLLPLGVVLTTLFGANYLYWALLAFQRGNVGFGVFYGVFGLGGEVLAMTIWRVLRQLRRPPA
jgi:hypothetical protein